MFINKSQQAAIQSERVRFQLRLLLFIDVISRNISNEVY